VTCRSCGQQIADKAIVCYRCGTPTAGPAASSPPRRGPAARWRVVPAILVIIVLAVWLVPKTPPETPARWIAWAAVAGITYAVVSWFRRR
jgi:hypothetical protein